MPFTPYEASLAELASLFASLAPPEASMRRGFFRARFIGPTWLRATGRPSVSLLGLRGWLGKRFLSADEATNVLATRGGTVEWLAMRVVPGLSAVDGRAGIALHYVPEHGRPAPLPWRLVRDELRAIDEDTMLGMTVIDLPVLRNLALPFLLERAS